jgi:hypothetical protein
MPEEGFPLPGSSYEELVKVIRAYDHFPGDVSLPEVSSIAGMHVSNVSRNNAFLVSIAVIQGGKKKSMTEAGRSLARALDHSIQEEIVRNWQSILAANDFLKKIVAAVRIRKGMEYSALQSHVAYTAGQPKSPTVMAGSGAVVDILKAAGALQEEDGKLVVTDSGPAATGSITGLVPEGETPLPPPGRSVSAQSSAPTNIPPSTVAAGVVPIAIQIQIQCSAQDVADLGPKIRNLLKELQTPESADKQIEE